MSAQMLLNRAISELPNLVSGERFTLKDLFPGYIWKRESKSDRIMAGTLFINYAQSNLQQIKILPKTSSTQEYEIL